MAETMKLLPCPFCGEEAVRRQDGLPMIYCGGDECMGPQTTAGTEQDAEVQWNTRAILSRLPAAGASQSTERDRALEEAARYIASCAALSSPEVARDLIEISKDIRAMKGGDGWRPMSEAPRDGTHILAYLHHAPDDCGYRGFGEWREIYWKPYRSLGMDMPWHAGDPWDSHSQNESPEHFGQRVPIAWMPLPSPPDQQSQKRGG